MKNRENIFSFIPDQIPGEVFETIISAGNLTIERIISRGHETPKGKWYDQNRNEWVLVLEGRAHLVFEDNPEEIVMKRGDYINIPSHRRHRVARTDPEVNTIWLAVHY